MLQKNHKFELSLKKYQIQNQQINFYLESFPADITNVGRNLDPIFGLMHPELVPLDERPVDGPVVALVALERLLA